MALMDTIRPATMLMDFNKALLYPPSGTFTRVATGDYLDDLGATVTAQANQPRLGYHLTDSIPRRGLVLGTGEAATRTDAADWTKSGQGTMLWVGTLASVATTSILWGLNDGTSSNFIRMRMDSATAGRLRLTCTVGGVAQFTADVINPLAVDTRCKIAVAWSGTTFRLIANDQEQATADSPAGVPASFTNLTMGSVATGFSGVTMDGTIERMVYWPFAMGYTQMRALTR